MVLSYSLVRVGSGFIPPSYRTVLLCVVALVSRIGTGPERDRRSDYEKDFGGNGPRVVCYVRVSSSDQTKGLSPETQEEELLAWAKLHRPSYLYMKFDNGKSGLDFTKRKIGTISELKREGRVREVWVRSVDRLGRDCFELVKFFLNFILEGGTIRTQEGIFTKDPTSFVTFVAIAFSAHISNEAKAQAALASKKRSFRFGKWNKPVPFGYSRKNDTTWIQKDLQKEEVVCEVFHLFLLRKNLAFVQSEIRRRYHLSVSRDRLRSVLSNPVYCGEPSLSGELVEDRYLAFISKDEFVQAQVMLQEIDRQHQRKGTELFQEIVINDVGSLHDFITQLYKHFRSCGGGVQVNGPRHDTSRPQIAFFCPACERQWRFPRRTPKGAGSTFPLITQGYEPHANTVVNKKSERKHVVPNDNPKANLMARLDPYFAPVTAI